MEKCYIFLCVWVFAGWSADAQAQTLNVLPPSTGGDPVGIWEATQTPLQVYIPPELLAAISTFTLNGSLSGQVTMDAGGGFVRDYIVTTKVKADLFFPINIDRIDTTRSEGTYRIEGTNLILTSQTVPVVQDTVGFSVRADSLWLFPDPGEEASLITVLVPDSGPPLPILRFIRTGTPPTPVVVLTADFDNNGAVDFPDFIAFAQQFGKRSGDAGFDAVFDLDNNGAVDFSDFITFAQQFGMGA